MRRWAIVVGAAFSIGCTCARHHDAPDSSVSLELDASRDDAGAGGPADGGERPRPDARPYAHVPACDDPAFWSLAPTLDERDVSAVARFDGCDGYSGAVPLPRFQARTWREDARICWRVADESGSGWTRDTIIGQRDFDGLVAGRGSWLELEAALVTPEGHLGLRRSRLEVPGATDLLELPGPPIAVEPTGYAHPCVATADALYLDGRWHPYPGVRGVVWIHGGGGIAAVQVRDRTATLWVTHVGALADPTRRRSVTLRGDASSGVWLGTDLYDTLSVVVGAELQVFRSEATGGIPTLEPSGTRTLPGAATDYVHRWDYGLLVIDGGGVHRFDPATLEPLEVAPELAGATAFVSGNHREGSGLWMHVGDTIVPVHAYRGPLTASGEPIVLDPRIGGPLAVTQDHRVVGTLGTVGAPPVPGSPSFVSAAVSYGGEVIMAALTGDDIGHGTVVVRRGAGYHLLRVGGDGAAGCTL